MKSVQNDMTVGSPMKMILSFTFPIFLGNVFQQFYNMADAVIVGKFVGTKALAAGWKLCLSYRDSLKDF